MFWNLVWTPKKKIYFQNLNYGYLAVAKYEQDSRGEGKGEEPGNDNAVWTDEETCDLSKGNKY